MGTPATRRIPKTDFGGSLCLPNNLGAGEQQPHLCKCGAPQSVQRETLPPLMNENADVVLSVLLIACRRQIKASHKAFDI